MYLRNLMSIDTEEMVRAQPMDAVVVIGGCDKTLPAQVMGAVSADKPAIVVPTGPMVVGHHKGEVLGACTDCRRLWAQHRAGKIDEAEIEVVSGRLAPSVGTCMVMGTASTMACVIEALGFSLPYAAAVPAVHAERMRIAEASGKQAVAMAKAGAPRPTRAVHRARLAQRADRAAGDRRLDQRHRASRRDGGPRRHHARSRCVRRAVEAGAGADRPEAVGRSLHGAFPSCRRRAAADAGDRPTFSISTRRRVAGTLRDHVKVAEQVPGQTVIRSRANPINPQGAMCVLRGNLAPRGAVIKQSAATPKLMTHEGRAVVFELGRGHDARGWTIRTSTSTADDVLVLRNAGPKGAPGMPEAGYLPIPKKLAQQGVKDMVRISDARMSGTAFGTIVLHITPESAGGRAARAGADRRPHPARRAEALDRTAGRRGRAAAPRRAVHRRRRAHEGSDRGYSWLFQQHVTQADEGCDFDFLRSVAHKPA